MEKLGKIIIYIIIKIQRSTLLNQTIISNIIILSGILENNIENGVEWCMYNVKNLFTA